MLADLHKPTAPAPRQSIDAAKTSNENKNHWKNADGFAAVSEITPWVRDTLRRRSRYECRNNSYARGVVSTLAADVVGTGPKLQLLTPDEAFNQFVEGEWREWADVTGFADKLRILDETRRRDGECFGLFRRNADAEARGLPSLDLRLIEGDQVAHPWGYGVFLNNPTGDDGVVCDGNGEVVSYKVLRTHPGDHRALVGKWEADDVPAADVIHWFRPERPGQLRGIPELTPALNLFAYLRRYTLAEVAKAEVGASLTAVLETDGPLNGEPEGFEPWIGFPITRGQMVPLPASYKFHEFTTNRPGAAPGEFIDTILREVGRCLDMPFGVVAGDSSKYNYSSARLDNQTYDLRQGGDKNRLRVRVLDRVFARWLSEMQLMYPALWAMDFRRLPARTWHFDARPSIDPVKDAVSDETNLANGSDTLTAIAGRSGRDVEDLIRETAREINLYAKYGVPLPLHLRDVGAPTPPDQATRTAAFQAARQAVFAEAAA